MNINNHIKKNIGFALSFIMVVSVFSTSLFADNLDVADGHIAIKGIGSTSSNGKFMFKEGVSKSDSILIDEIVITYPDHKKAILSISDGNDTIFHAEVTNNLTTGEMKRFNSLILYPQNNYIITHGDKSWNVVFADTQIEPIVNRDSIIQRKAISLGIPEWRIEEGFVISKTASDEDIDIYLGDVLKNLNNNKESNIPWWIYLIILLLGLTYVYLSLPTLKKTVLGKINKKAKTTQPESTSNEETLPQHNINSSNKENKEKGENSVEDVVNPNNELIVLREKISSLLPNEIDKELSDDQKIVRIKLLLESGREAKEGLRLIRYALNVEDENVVPLFLYDKVEELKINSTTVSKEAYRNVRGEICNILIEKILGKKNRTLSDVVADAMAEKGTNQYEIILKVIDLLPFRVKDDKVTAPNVGQPIAITDNQLRNSSNTYILKKWLKEQLNAVGISGFDMNRTVLDNLTILSNRLKDAQDVSPRKTDEDIVDGVILEQKLSDGQKQVLIRRLIDIINGKIMDPSKSISKSLSLDEFAQSIADAFQQPNSHEEAQMQTQQRNIAIVNEALGSEMTSLSKETIKDTVKRVVLSFLQSKLPNISINSYDEALSSLSTCNSQYKELEKLFQDFDVDTLQNLPKAIREKQNTELLKSVSDKVSSLFPEQNIDSVQRLVNALFREVKETRESRDLIADDLEERISLRDKTYTASDGNRDVLKLMSLYGSLINTEEAKLREQITLKDNKIEQLNEDIANERETISSLENDNKDLMSESDKLIEKLHVSAEKILESCKTILNPCSDDEEVQCVDIEERLFSDLNSSVAKLKIFNVDKNTVPAATRKTIQDLLVTEISADNSPVNTVCRYYAYSQLPFMTDTAREYGVTFNRKNMAELYNAIENLYVQFGINLNIPSLFVMGIDEGVFENVTGKMYGDLDNLCQNSRNHFDNIDSATKPSNVIVDVVNIGYSIDGQVGRVTSVLTY